MWATRDGCNPTVNVTKSKDVLAYLTCTRMIFEAILTLKAKKRMQSPRIIENKSLTISLLRREVQDWLDTSQSRCCCQEKGSDESQGNWCLFNFWHAELSINLHPLVIMDNQTTATNTYFR